MNDSPDPFAFTPAPTGSTRHDGWTPVRQKQFVAALAVMGVVGSAAKATGMSRKSAYALRNRPGAEDFASAWDEALEQGRQRAFDIAIDRALNGVTSPLYYKGRVVGTRHRFDHRLAVAALTPRSPPPGRVRT